MLTFVNRMQLVYATNVYLDHQFQLDIESLLHSFESNAFEENEK